MVALLALLADLTFHPISRFVERLKVVDLLIAGVIGCPVVLATVLMVDLNLSTVKKKWGDDLDSTVVIESPKKNAAKMPTLAPRAKTAMGVARASAGYISEIMATEAGFVPASPTPTPMRARSKCQ